MTSATISATRPSALLSAADSLAARPLLRWSADELERFADAVAAALSADALRWGADDALRTLVDADPTRGAARAVHAEEVEPSARPADWTEVSGQGAWWHLGESPTRRISRALFGSAGGGASALDGRGVADELAADLWAGQLQAVATLVATDHGLADADARARTWRRWSGAVFVTLPWCGATLHLLFDARQVARVLLAPGARGKRVSPAAGAHPVPALRALADHRARLTVRLDPFDIDLGSLVSLNVGDVLHLRHALDKPAHVCAAGAPIDHAPLCAAWLGRRDGALAIELARLAVATEPSRAKSHS